jgi:cyclopropane fatty-acyl-phospholipid synthase-like methyltransferase
MKPYSEACDQNREPILEVITPLFAQRHNILEIGSGTGQHAVYFATQLAHLVWHTSDLEESHRGIQMWIDEAGLSNVRAPIQLDVCQPQWPDLSIDAIFSANTTHIMHWPAVQALFAGVGLLLPVDGLLVLYGPFNYNRQYTSESNAHFDSWLKARDPLSGIRDVEDLNTLADKAGMILSSDYSMPANNHILCWEKPQNPVETA